MLRVYLATVESNRRMGRGLREREGTVLVTEREVRGKRIVYR